MSSVMLLSTNRHPGRTLELRPEVCYVCGKAGPFPNDHLLAGLLASLAQVKLPSEYDASGREDRKRFYNSCCKVSSKFIHLEVSHPAFHRQYPLLELSKLPKGECALFDGGFLGFPLQSVGFPREFSQGFP